MQRPAWKQLFSLTVVVAALGYFVDIFDLLLFPIVKNASLLAIGVPQEQLLEVGAKLLSWQMNGMLAGGLLWGILGDKRGRLSVLFGSIALYSLANLANAFVTTVPMYTVVRFLAGFGLAGELGAAITLVSETLPKDLRGYGASIVAGVGISGAVLGGIAGKFLSWKAAYILGGVLGLALLALRVGVAESGMFHHVKAQNVSRGSLWMLVSSPERFARFLRPIIAGLPIWYVVGILVVNAESFAPLLGVQGRVENGIAVACCYAGGAAGDIASGFLSQSLRSRKRAIEAYLMLSLLAIFAYLSQHGLPAWGFYALCSVLGFSFGYWAMLLTMASEQFGTNLRATVTTTVPNVIRGSLTLITFAFLGLKPSLGLVGSAALVGMGCLLMGFMALQGMDESFGKDLDYVE